MVEAAVRPGAVGDRMLLGPMGVVTRDLLGLDFDVYGPQGMVLVMSLSFFPVAYVGLGLMRHSIPALDEAAAKPAHLLAHLPDGDAPAPAARRRIGFLLLFVEALADLGNPIVLGGNFQVLASRCTSRSSASPTRWAARCSASCCSFRASSSSSCTAATPSGIGRVGHRQAVRTSGGADASACDFAADGARAGVSALVLLMYGTIVFGAFTNLVGVDNTLTTKNFEFVLFGYGLEAVSDTVFLAAVATPLAGMLGVVIAFLVIRGRFWGRGALDFATMLGVAVPGTVFGIGYLLSFNTPTELFGITVLPKLTGGPAILGGAIAIVMVFIVRSAPGGLRSGAAALQQIDPTIEEASVSLGADQTTTFRRVVLPLIRPAFLTGLIYSFARSMTAISAIVFLTTPSTRIMTQQILNETNAARFGNALAYCVILIVIVLAAIGFLYWIIGSSTRVDRGVAAEPPEATLVRST